MNKVNKINQLILLITCTLFILLPSESLAVGFHSAGGGGGGGSSSSGGDGSLLGYIFILIIFAIISYISKKRRGFVADAKRASLLAAKDSFLIEDYNFSIDILESQIQNNILDVLYALRDEDIEQLDVYCTEDFISQISNSNNFTLNSLVDLSGHICWIDSDINNIYSDDNYDFIDLKLSFKVINDETGTISSIPGAIVSLKRRDKVISPGLNQRPQVNNCKSCGAPMDFNASHTCNYCGSISKLSEDDTWMICDIRGIATSDIQTYDNQNKNNFGFKFTY